MFKTIITAALFGLSVNAFAAVSDLSNVTHGSQAGQETEDWPDQRSEVERPQRRRPADRSQAVREIRWQLPLR